MKRMKKFVSVMLAAALTALLPGAAALHVSAASPTTYYVKYDSDKHDWRMQIGEWIDEYEGRETYYLNAGDEAVKDGDILVILSNEEAEAGPALTVNARLSNLTVNRANVVISASGIDECHVLGDSYASITGNVSNAYVYDTAKCTFNSNVTNLRLVATEKNDVETSVSVAGTVAYACVSNSGGVIREFYNFVAGSFYYDYASGLMTDPSQYSTNGSSPAPQTQSGAGSAAANQPQGSQPTASGSANDYDDVPKTGESNLLFFLLLGLSAMSFAGCMALNLKKEK